MSALFEHPTVPSTHAANRLGETLFRATLALQPRKVIEFGVLNGYSTLCIAQALRMLSAGHLFSYDLWEDFPYNHGKRSEVQATIEQAGLGAFVTLGKMDFWDWVREPDDCDLMYVDIAHDGAVIEAAVAALGKLRRQAVLIFEGGSSERDNVPWMKQFKKQPIAPLRARLGFRLLDGRFPSLSILPGDALNDLEREVSGGV